MAPTPCTIVIPVHRKGGKFGTNRELGIAVRSIRKHFVGPFNIVICARQMPPGFEDCTHLPDGGKGLKSALACAANAYPAGFFWWYDDCVLLQPQTAEQLKLTLASPRWVNAQTSWAKKLNEIRDRLEAEGYQAWDYSRPHGPYWFDKSMIDESFADWPGMAGKFPFESWILSKRDWPRRHGNCKQYYGQFKSEPGANDVLLNYCDGGCTPELMAWLDEKFPAEAVPAPGKVEVHTLRFGDRWWMQLCVPTLDAWCAKHGHPLTIWNADNINPAYPSPKFCEVDMLKQFLAGGSDWLLYVDADVYVDAGAPFSPPLQFPGFHIREDIPGGGPRDFRRWLRRNGKEVSAGWIYRNAGVWACDRESARQLLAVISEPYLEGCQEQHQWNHWLSLAEDAGMPVVNLPPAWNAWAHESEPGAFYHIAGKRKTTRLRQFRANGRIPNDDALPAATPPPTMKTFDDAPYQFTHHPNGWDTDDMHIHALHAAACLDLGVSPGARIAVEVGSFRGKSTAALIEALNKGFLDHLHIVEVKPTESLRQVIALANDPAAVTLHTQPFWDIDIGPISFAFIDGDHRWPAVADTLRALSLGARVIALHDTQAWPRMADLWGSHLAAKTLKQFADRSWIEDAADRPGLRTFRGFLVSAVSGVDLSSVSAVLDGAEVTESA